MFAIVFVSGNENGNFDKEEIYFYKTDDNKTQFSIDLQPVLDSNRNILFSLFSVCLWYGDTQTQLEIACVLPPNIHVYKGPFCFV